MGGPRLTTAICHATPQALDALIKRSGKNQSAIVREAIHEYLVERKLVS
ncbi:ribbon-helix-helix protein, CopG family [Leifsonia sp. NPDC102414]